MARFSHLANKVVEDFRALQLCYCYQRWVWPLPAGNCLDLRTVSIQNGLGRVIVPVPEEEVSRQLEAAPYADGPDRSRS